MLESATGEDEREVLVAVGVGVAEAASIEDLGAIQQRLDFSHRNCWEKILKKCEGYSLRIFSKIGQNLRYPFYDRFQLEII